MIQFYIQDSFDPKWHALAQHVASLWPKTNLCIVAEKDQLLAIENAIWQLEDRFIPCSQNALGPHIVYITADLPSEKHWTINTSNLQLQAVNVEWVTDKERARERYKHWRSLNHALDVHSV